jgi:STE24 endopeptidase
MPEGSTDKIVERAARYSSIKYILALMDIVYLLLLLCVFMASGVNLKLSLLVERFSVNKTLDFLLYLSMLLACYSILDLPFNFCRSYLLERRFGLSNQKLKSWIAEQLKAGLVSYIASIVAFGFLYYFLRNYPLHWWIIVTFLWLFFSLFLAKIFPSLILPLFFKYRRLDREALRERIIRLAGKMQVPILDVFEIDFSKRTNKGNAALIGWGKGRRVVLADTLRGSYSDEEIEVILAHEFAHYKLMHLLKLALLNSLATLLAFYLIFKTSVYLAGFFGIRSLSDIAG